MAAKTFSKKEAISRGLQMTKKYFGTVIFVMITFVAFYILQWSIEKEAGAGDINRFAVTGLYKTPADADKFYQYLQDAGYIDHTGKNQDKLNDLRDVSQLDLPPTLEADRTKIFNFLKLHQYHLPFPRIVYYFLLLFFWIVGMLMQVGTVRMYLMISRDEKPELAELFFNGSYLVAYILSGICFTLAVIGGFVLLIVPGIILSLSLGMYQYFIVDQNMGPMQALGASRRITKGARWQIFCFGALLFLFNLAGALCLLVGLIVTIPASYIAGAYVYDQLRLQSENVADA